MSGSEYKQSDLKKRLDTTDTSWQQPVIYDLNKIEHQKEIEKLFRESQIAFVHNRADIFLEELYFEDNPQQKDKKDPRMFEEFIKEQGEGFSYGAWVYYPWRKSLVHFPGSKELNKLRTSRNRYLIKPEEQDILSSSTLAIFGLSVGSNVAEALVNQGLGKHYILVDLDVLEPTNLNRIRSPFHEIGLNKADVIAKKINEINPFAELTLYRDGLNQEVLDEIINKYNPDILIDEMDDLEMKIAVRRRASEAKKPVLMATDNSDGALLDIERYDIDENTEIFNGLIPKQIIDDLENKRLSRAQAGSLIGRYFVGFERVSLRMLESLEEVGKSLPSWPQLGSAAALSGLLVAYATKNILLGGVFDRDRYEVNLEQLIPVEGVDYESDGDKQRAIERLMDNA